MTSQRAIQANRLNSRKSRGPRTSQGKRAASRNSRKHGLASLRSSEPADSAEIERLVRALCAGDRDAVLLAKARLVAENEMVLRAVRTQKLAVIERLRDPNTAPLAEGDNSLAQARARFEEVKRAERTLDELVPMLAAKYKDQLPPMPETIPGVDRNEMVLAFLMELFESSDRAEQEEGNPEHIEQLVDQQELGEYEALQRAAPDLTRLARYEGRAWSRQKRALRDFIDIQRRRDRD